MDAWNHHSPPVSDSGWDPNGHCYDDNLHKQDKQRYTLYYDMGRMSYQLIRCGFHFLHGSALQKVKSASDCSIVVLQVPG